MKKKLLSLCCFMVTVLYSDLKAQDFDLDFYQYFNAHMADYNKTTAKDAATAWRGNKTDGSQGPVVTMNQISASFAQNNRINSISINDDNTATGNYVRAQFQHNDCKLIITSEVDIKTIALVYRGSNDTEAGAFKITYAPSLEDLELFPTVYEFPTASGVAPGQAKFYNIPEEGIRCVVIQRNSTINSRLYRVAVSSSTFTTLPLDFVSFTAKASAIGNNVNLNWRTVNEVNTKEFIIERGTSATAFKAIGSLASANTSGVHNYGFEDVTAPAGTSYYRIKQVDMDGKFAYSEVREVNVKIGQALSVYPNPTSDILNVSHEAAKNASLKVLNSQGQSVISHSLTNGSSSTNLSLSTLASGVYYLVLNNDGKQSSFKFVKN